MFGGFDPFESIGSMMHRQMRDMENMMDSMNSMMDPFGAMGGRYGARSSRNPRQHMIEDDPRSSNQRGNSNPMAVHPFHNNMMMPFGGGMFGGGMLGGMTNMMQQMEALKERAATDPNSHMYTQSTVISVAPGADGRMNYYEKTDSMRKAGEVKEIRNSLRDSSKGVEKMSIGHHIGDRGHVIQKKRDKEGRIVENQEFFGINEDEARTFDDEWANTTKGAVYGGRDRVQNGRHHQRHLPIEGSSRGEFRERHASPYTRAKDRKKKGPIIEEAD